MRQKLVFEMMKLGISDEEIYNALEFVLNEFPRDKYTTELFFSAGAIRVKVYERDVDNETR